MKLETTWGGYDAGTELRDMTIQEARALECNRCGDCCSGLRDGVKKDEATGMPLMTWGSKFPEDRYESRYGEPMLLPIIRGDGGPTIGDAFEVDDDGKPYTAFKCAFLIEHGEETTCSLYAGSDPEKPETCRPLNCGDFPVFGLQVDDAIIAGQSFIPMTGALPRCVWHGIRVTGPWKQTPYWKERWEKQQRGEDVEDLTLRPEVHREIVDALRTRALMRERDVAPGD